jgi:hypothetical protein
MFPVAIGTAAASGPFIAMFIDLLPATRYVWGITFCAYVLSGLLILACRPPRLKKGPEASETVIPEQAARAQA